MTNSPHGGSIVGAVLQEHGVQCVYTLCGGHISPILLGAKNHGLTVVDVRDEASAAFAADAAGRMTGIPGVCAVTAGPGVTNTITAVKNAQMAQQPMIILGGATATILRGRGALQDIDQLALMRPVTKWATRVSTVQAIRPVLTKAFEVATNGIPGPVFVEFPVDVLYPEEVVAEWYMKESGVDKMKGAVGAVAKVAMKTYLRRQFHMPHLPLPGRSPSLSTPDNVAGFLGQVAKAVHGAIRPVLVIGNQAMVNLTPTDAERLADAVTQIGLPTFLGGSARGLLGRHSEIQFRHKRTAALKEADLVIVAGFPFDFRMGYGQKINRKATIVSINLDAEALRKNRKPDIAILAHPGRFLMQLADRVQGERPSRGAWVDTLKKRESDRDTEITGNANPNGPLVDPAHFYLRLEEHLSDDAILIVDGGDFVATGAYILRPRKPLSWLDPGVFGTLGVGGGFALGAASVRPETEIWLLYGDGSSAYSLAEFDTYVRLGYAPIAVIGNDASWNQIARDQVVILGDPVGTELKRSPYHTVAEGYGGRGLLLTEPEQIDDVISEAKRLSAQGIPVCINVHLQKSDFRKGSISI